MLAIAGAKGGCGKTTTTLGLARSFAQQGMDPLVVDVDCDMPDVHHLVDIDRSRGVGVPAVAAGQCIERAAVRPAAVPGVRILPAGSGEETSDALDRLRSWHGPVLLDCPAGVSPDATRPLRAATAAVLVTTDEPQCLQDTRQTVAVASQLEAKPVGIVVRQRACEQLDSVGPVPVVATVPTVSTPFENPRVRQVWNQLCHTLRGRTGTAFDTNKVT